jgi:hypothetical protein
MVTSVCREAKIVACFADSVLLNETTIILRLAYSGGDCLPNMRYFTYCIVPGQDRIDYVSYSNACYANCSQSVQFLQNLHICSENKTLEVLCNM